MRRPWFLLALALPLAGCPYFLVDRGEIVEPVRTLDVPTASSAPKADAWAEMVPKFRRGTRVGIGGYVEATLVDPGLAAAQVSHEAAIQNAGPAQLSEALQARWPVLFGTLSDRFPIDLEWRFDEQFITNRRILDPAGWAFALRTSGGGPYAPLAATVLRAEPAPRNGSWGGRVRLWFPWVDPSSRVPLLAGGTSWMTLEMRHPSGTGEVSWRFRTSF